MNDIFRKRIEINSNASKKRKKSENGFFLLVNSQKVTCKNDMARKKSEKDKNVHAMQQRTLLKNIHSKKTNKWIIKRQSILSNSNTELGFCILHTHTNKHIQPKSAALPHTYEEKKMQFWLWISETCKSSCCTQIDFEEQQSKLLGAEFMWVNVRNRLESSISLNKTEMKK